MNIRNGPILILAAATFGVAGLPRIAAAGWFGPKNYDECILESMKGVTSDVAARAIMRSCREKFSTQNQPKTKTRPLTKDELENLDGRAGSAAYGDRFEGTLYNGNRDITVFEVSIVIVSTVDGKKISRTYSADVQIPPQASGPFSFRILPGDQAAKLEWGIVSARGD